VPLSKTSSMRIPRLLPSYDLHAILLPNRTASENVAYALKVQGESALAMLKIGIWSALQGQYISEYDAMIGQKLACILTGGHLTGEQTVSEQYLLDLEREAVFRAEWVCLGHVAEIPNSGDYFTAELVGAAPPRTTLRSSHQRFHAL